MRAVFSYVKRFLALPSAQRNWFLRCWWQFALWHIRIQYFPYRRWKQLLLLKHTGSGAPRYQLDLQDAVQISEMAARHHIFPINCLRRCIVQQQLLAQCGYTTHLHFGVAKSQRQLKAHCWLTHQGRLVNDGPEVVNTYTELTLASEQTGQIVASLR